jgi:hypothetical protein
LHTFPRITKPQHFPTAVNGYAMSSERQQLMIRGPGSPWLMSQLKACMLRLWLRQTIPPPLSAWGVGCSSSKHQSLKTGTGDWRYKPLLPINGVIWVKVMVC